MTRARDVSKLVTTPPNIYATDSESSAGFLSLSSASSTYQTKASNQFPYRNLVINGAMQVAQRGTSTASITSDTYATTDRWRFLPSSQGTWTMSVENDAPTGSGFRKSTKVLCTTADASPAGADYVRLDQRIEGQNLQVVKKGTAAAQQLTISFWVKANVTGTYIVSFYDNDNNRVVSKSYTINASATWEYKTITFPADTTGALDNDNDVSLILIFRLGVGSNYSSGTLQTTWATYSDANSAVGQVNLASAINNYWQVTGVQLEVGDTATPFEFKSFDVDSNECFRYYQEIPSMGTRYFVTGYQESAYLFGQLQFLKRMRANPTITAPAANTFDIWTVGAPTNINVQGTNTDYASIRFDRSALTNFQVFVIQGNGSTFWKVSAEL
jgi:hypothetical protein